jgi:hypothetical protein
MKKADQKFENEEVFAKIDANMFAKMNIVAKFLAKT